MSIPGAPVFFAPFQVIMWKFLIADSDSSAIQVESSKCKDREEEEEEENFNTSFLVGLVRGLSDGAKLKGPTRGGGE